MKKGRKIMIPLFKVHMPATVDEPLLEVLHSGWIGQGVKIDKFEDELKAILDNEYVLTLNNGTAGLHLALRLAEVGYKDEVITTPMTCLATNMPILACGAFPIWADIDPETGNIDPMKIEKNITARTKAIACVHFGGYPCDMDEISQIAKTHDLRIIEDAAHALRAEYKGHPIGTHSDFVMFSLQAIKHITTIDGGILCCKSERDYKLGKLLRWYGIDRETSKMELRCEGDVKDWGYKHHMNDVTATIGLEQLKYLGEVIEKHRRNATYYNMEFKARQIKRSRPLRYKSDRLSSYWLYTLLVDDRDGFVRFMRDNGIGASKAHVRNDVHSCFKKFKRDDLPGVDYFDAHQVAIPVHWDLKDEDRNHIMNTIEQWDRER